MPFILLLKLYLMALSPVYPLA